MKIGVAEASREWFKARIAMARTVVVWIVLGNLLVTEWYRAGAW